MAIVTIIVLNINIIKKNKRVKMNKILQERSVFFVSNYIYNYIFTKFLLIVFSKIIVIYFLTYLLVQN
jgi:hypothetical protein